MISDQLLESRCSEEPDVLCRFEQRLLHEKRYECTPLGRLFADAFWAMYAVDIIWFPSKNIRTESCGPSVTYINLLQTLPYDGGFVRIELSGAQIAALLTTIYPTTAQERVIIPLQYSKGFEVIYDCKNCTMNVRFQGEDLSGQHKMYVVGMPSYVYDRFSIYFGEPPRGCSLQKTNLVKFHAHGSGRLLQKRCAATGG